MLYNILKLLRPKQWTKNLFVLAPLFFSGELLQPILALSTIFAAFLFSLMSSAAYVLNDIADLERDRQHPKKRLRPLVSGEVPISIGWALFAVLVGFSLALTWFLTWKLSVILILYLTVNIAYSYSLKQIAIVDVFCISSGFIFRVIAGGVVSGVYISHWLLLCTLTLSLFLAFGKRREEFVSLQGNPSDQRPSLQGYSLSFLDHAISTVATLTIICYILYVADPETTEFFGTRAVLITSIFVLYGMFHYLNLLQTRQQGGNPVTMLLSDRPLQLACLGWGLTWFIIIVFKKNAG
ncbi:MAG: decaprenyl-phosphate phosphoribosyltransferase [Deltaproteobacteria bacterium]|nr:decaprenyl-phosphate phosphoribosyltransferase [Deltaproteobacteria bacterium]